MGRHHALKPSHLYTSYPAHYPAPFASVKAGLPSPTALFPGTTVTTLSVKEKIPGFKTSAAFLSSLQHNIFIELDSGYDSADENNKQWQSIVTRRSASHLCSMSSLSQSDTAPPEALRVPTAAHLDDDEVEQQEKEPILAEDGLPILKTFAAATDETRSEALRVIADSVAQQRNMASRAIIYHPLTLAVWTVVLAALYKQFWTGDKWDWLKILTTFLGTIMATLGAIRMWCGPYIFEAERVGTWAWLNKGRLADDEEHSGLRAVGESDEILVTKFGGEYIGAIVFRGVQPVPMSSPTTANKRTRRAQSPSKHTKTVIRAWSVAQKYRRKEIGTALLDEAIRTAMGKGWTSDGVEFAQDHANSKRVLPAMFNGPLDKYEQVAQTTLKARVDSLVYGQDKGRRRK